MFLTALQDKVRLQAKVLREYKRTRIEDFSEIDGKHVCDRDWVFSQEVHLRSDVQVAREIGLASSFIAPQQIIRSALEDDTQSLYRVSQNADLIAATDFKRCYNKITLNFALVRIVFVK